MKRELTLFDRPENVRRLLLLFFIFLGVLLVVDVFIPRHPEFYWEARADFFAAYGFLSCVALIYIAKGLRWLIKRDEDYYDR